MPHYYYYFPTTCTMWEYTSLFLVEQSNRSVFQSLADGNAYCGFCTCFYGPGAQLKAFFHSLFSLFKISR